MPTFDEVLALARQLAPADRQRVAQALGGAGLAQVGPARPGLPAAHSIAWVKAERGHAVLATDSGPAEADIPAGAPAIAGMWRDRRPDDPEAQP